MKKRMNQICGIINQRINMKNMAILCCVCVAIVISCVVWCFISMYRLANQEVDHAAFVFCNNTNINSDETIVLEGEKTFIDISLNDEQYTKYFDLVVSQISENNVQVQLLDLDADNEIGVIKDLHVGDNYSSYIAGKHSKIRMCFSGMRSNELKLSIDRVVINDKTIVWHVALLNIIKFYLMLIFFGGIYLLVKRGRVINIKRNYDKESSKTFLKFVMKTSVVLIMGIIAIIRANYIYIDDFARIEKGTLDDWISFSRFFSIYLCRYLNAANDVFDTSPLNQILTMICMAIAYAIVVWSIDEKKLKSNWMILGSIPFALSPYFLENISYKIESVIHGVAVLLSVLPLVREKKRDFKFIILSAICTVMVAITYQGTLGVYPLVIVFILANEWNKGTDYKLMARLAISSVVGYCSGLLVFKLFLMKPVDAGYSASTMLPLSKIIPGLLKNYKRYYQTMNSDFTMLWKILIILILITFVLVYALTSKRNRLISIVVALTCEVIMFLSCYGIYPLLETYALPPRIMYEYFIVIGLLEVFILSKKILQFEVRIISIVLAWSFIVLAMSYGNCLSIQSEYTMVRMQTVVDYINNNIDSDTPHLLHLRGGIGKSPILNRELGKMPVLAKLVPASFDSGWSWSEYRYRNFYGLSDNYSFANSWTDQNIDIDELKKIDDTTWFDVYSDGYNVVINLSPEK